MACYRPLRAFKTDSGGIQFNITRDAMGFVPLPCGQCIGCRLERSRQWAVRCMHEAQFHTANSFITLTYSPEHLPADRSLNKRHLQLFVKRLRKLTNTPIRYFACGEYGEKYSRPHYHALIFGYDFPDKEYFFSSNGVAVFKSEFLDSVWGKGYCTVGDLTFESAAYTARYCVKKFTGARARENYFYIDDYGQFFDNLQPEFAVMSLKPGIGRDWLDSFYMDVYPSDQLVIKRKDRYVAMKPPRYYDSVYSLIEPEIFAQLKFEREAAHKGKELENSGVRLAAKHRVKSLQVSKLKRGYENETFDSRGL